MKCLFCDNKRQQVQFAKKKKKTVASLKFKFTGESKMHATDHVSGHHKMSFID